MEIGSTSVILYYVSLFLACLQLILHTLLSLKRFRNYMYLKCSGVLYVHLLENTNKKGKMLMNDMVKTNITFFKKIFFIFKFNRVQFWHNERTYPCPLLAWDITVRHISPQKQ